MIVALAGLPGTGKSTLAQALAKRCNGAVLNKDQVRAALFPAPWTSYTIEQDDFVLTIMLQAIRRLVQHHNCPAIFIDGRTFSRTYQRDLVRKAASELGRPFHILVCICADATALKRIEADAGHPAADRNADLYWRIKAVFEPIPDATAIVDTEQPIEVCLSICLQALGHTKSVNPMAE